MIDDLFEHLVRGECVILYLHGRLFKFLPLDNIISSLHYIFVKFIISCHMINRFKKLSMNNGRLSNHNELNKTV